MPDQTSAALLPTESAVPDSSSQTDGSAATSADTAAAPGGISPTIDLKALLDQHPELADEVLRHPTLKQRYERDVQSASDRKAANLAKAERQRWENEQAARDAAEKRRQERQQKLDMDPTDLGLAEKQRLQKEDVEEPIRAELSQSLQAKAWDEGYQASVTEIVTAINKHPIWQRLPLQERQKLVAEVDGSLPDLNERLIEMLAEERANERVERRLAELKKAQQREGLAEQRSGRPAPDLGGGTATQNDAAFLSAFAEGQSSDFARARKLMGMS